MDQLRYSCHETVFGTVVIVWIMESKGPRIYRIYLPGGDGDSRADAIDGLSRGSHPLIEDIGADIGRFCEGGKVEFDMGVLVLERCSGFMRNVLLTERTVPRGRVCTYGSLADRLGMPKGARAVGSALAANPFPVIIPCHRTVRSDGVLGGFQGGLVMKRRLLETEGVLFQPDSKVDIGMFAYDWQAGIAAAIQHR